MDFINRENLLHNILEPSFPLAKNIEILEMTKGEHDYQHTSILIMVAIQYEQEGEKYKKNLALKIPETDGAYFQLFRTMNMYDRESYVYKTIIPKIRHLLDDPIIPVCYHTTDSAVLVMENILSQGYESVSQRQFLNFQQSCHILEALSQFHAASHKVCQATPSLLDNMLFQTSTLIASKHSIVDSWEPVIYKMLNMKNATHLVDKLKVAIEYLRQNDLESKLNHSNFKFNVLNHGDFRITNLMLKFNSKDRRVEQVKFVDFQMCKWTSPALDLIYFFTFSVQVDVIHDHFETLIDKYLHFLSQKLGKLNCSTTYDKQNFMTDFQSLASFLVLCVICLCNQLSPLDQEERRKAPLDEEGKENMAKRCLHDEKWVHYLFGWLEFCHEYKIFDALGEEGSPNQLTNNS